MLVFGWGIQVTLASLRALEPALAPPGCAQSGHNSWKHGFQHNITSFRNLKCLVDLRVSPHGNVPVCWWQQIYLLGRLTLDNARAHAEWSFHLLWVKAEQQIPWPKISRRALVPAGGDASCTPLLLCSHATATGNDSPCYSWGWKARAPSTDGTTPTRFRNLSLGFKVPLMVPTMVLSNSH